jgi:adenylate cyclase
MTLFAELRRRNVIRMAGLYLVASWLMLQVAETLLPIFDTPGWVLKSLVVLTAIGFVPALVFSWVFELTAEGLVRDDGRAAGHAAAPHAAKRLDHLTLAGVLLVLAVIAADRYWPHGIGATSTNDSVADARQRSDAVAPTLPPDAVVAASIAVLPFADLSPAGDQSYFSDGIAEEILNVLVRVDGLQVASRTSAFGFRGQEALGLPVIAERLKVRHILEGSVRRAGDSLRITAQLIDAHTDRHIWSENFDRPLTAENVFAIQDEIARAIVAALVDSLGLNGIGDVATAQPTSNLSALEHYLQARVLFQGRRNLGEAERLLVRSLEQDPQYAKAWELRSAVQTMLREYGGSNLDSAELDRRAVEFAERALALDPHSALALASLANLRARDSRQQRARVDLTLVVADLERSIELDPHNGNAMNWLGVVLGQVGRMEDSLAWFERCIVIEPRLAPCTENAYEALWALGRADEAYAMYQHGLERSLMTPSYASFALLAHFEDRPTFLFAINQPIWLQGWDRIDAVYAAYRNLGGDHSELLAELRTYLQGRDQDYLGHLLIPLGAHEAQVPWPLLYWGSEFARYRQSEPFKRFIERSGTLDYWQAHGFPPQCRSVGEADFACDLTDPAR